jgi:hypothetical protein
LQNDENTKKKTKKKGSISIKEIVASGKKVFKYIWLCYRFTNQEQIKLIDLIYLMKMFIFELPIFHPLV